MTLTKSSIKKTDLVALLENLKRFDRLSAKEREIFEAINVEGTSKDYTVYLNDARGVWGCKNIGSMNANKIYRLKPDTTLKQLREACFPTAKVEERFWEYEVFEKECYWGYTPKHGHNCDVVANMNRTDFAGLKYGVNWYMTRQLEKSSGLFADWSNDNDYTIPIPSAIRFKKPKFKEGAK